MYEKARRFARVHSGSGAAFTSIAPGYASRVDSGLEFSVLCRTASGSQRKTFPHGEAALDGEERRQVWCRFYGVE